MRAHDHALVLTACTLCVLAHGLRQGHVGPGRHVGKCPCASTQHTSVPPHEGEQVAASGESTAASLVLSTSDVVPASVASAPPSTASCPCSSELELHAMTRSVTAAITPKTRMMFMRVTLQVDGHVWWHMARPHSSRGTRRAPAATGIDVSTLVRSKSGAHASGRTAYHRRLGDRSSGDSSIS